jgi:predicted RNase H-like nuclease (RuvC/YqgF family)
MADQEQQQRDLAKMTAWGRGLEHDKRLLHEENARLKAEVERLTQLNSTLALRYDATNSMLDGCAKEIEEMEEQVERLTGELGELEGIRSYLKWNGLQADLKDWLDWRSGKNGSEIPFPKDFLPPNA